MLRRRGWRRTAQTSLQGAPGASIVGKGALKTQDGGANTGNCLVWVRLPHVKLRGLGVEHAWNNSRPRTDIKRASRAEIVVLI
jgi:hypothetical protein